MLGKPPRYFDSPAEHPAIFETQFETFAEVPAIVFSSTLASKSLPVFTMTVMASRNRESQTIDIARH